MREYALNTWNIRQENPGKNPLNMTAKLLGNGLCGKFAQKRERTFLAQIPFEEGCKMKYELVFPEFNLWKIPTVSDSTAILPYISAAITSYSRIILHRFLRMYPDKVVYCDTDSVFIDSGQKLPSGKNLGEMKFEQNYKRFIAIQPKFYLAEYKQPIEKMEDYTAEIFGIKLKYKIKNIKKHKLRAKGFVDDHLNWSYNDFEYALKTGNYDKFFQQQEPKIRKLNESIKVKNFLALVTRKKGVKTEYDKRIINKDFTTKPITIGG